MTPIQALLAAINEGARLSVNTTTYKLVVEWDEPISDETMAALKEHRDWIIAHLLQPPRPPLCGSCGRAQHEPDIICGPELCPAWQEPDRNYAVAPPFIPLPPLERVCPDCQQTNWWTRADGGQVCGVCHPDPRVLLEQRQARQEAPME